MSKKVSDKVHCYKEFEALEEIREQNAKLNEYCMDLARDYKYFALHSHLFTGPEEVWCSKLDSVFDSAAFDEDMFGLDSKAHLRVFSIIGGLFGFPFFLISLRVFSGGSLFD